MCLQIDLSIHKEKNKGGITPRSIILTKPMTVWKVVLKVDIDNVISIHRHFRYKRGRDHSIGKTKIDKVWYNDKFYVKKGFHAYKSRGVARREKNVCWGYGGKPKSVCKFLFPIGSTVFFGIEGDIVSNRITFPKILKK